MVWLAIGEKQIGAAAGAFDLDAEALVGFFVDEHGRAQSSQGVAIEAMRALGGFVFDGVEKRAIVGSPGGAGDALDASGERFVGAEILDLQRVLAKAGDVERVSEEMRCRR